MSAKIKFCGSPSFLPTPAGNCVIVWQIILVQIRTSLCLTGLVKFSRGHDLIETGLRGITLFIKTNETGFVSAYYVFFFFYLSALTKARFCRNQLVGIASLY